MTMPQNPLNTSEYSNCKICGMSHSNGGREDAKKCAEIKNKLDMEDIYLTEIANLLDCRSDNRPFYLLMAGFEVLDMLSVGFAVSNISGRVLLSNRTAEQILAASDGLAVTARGFLRSPRGCALSDLIEQTANAVQDQNSELSSVALAIPRPSGKRPLILLLRSVRNVSSEPDIAETLTLLFILDPEMSVAVGMSELRELYGFTRAEARLANLLMEGNSLEKCCHQLGIGRSTACTHLRQLFRKTGARRQSELVSLLFKSIGLVGTRGLLPVLFEIGLARTRSEGRVMKSRSSFAHRGVHTAI